MIKQIITGRITSVRHDPGELKPLSILTVEVERPYLHEVDLDLFWCPALYHQPGDLFADSIATAERVIIEANIDDRGRLSATRADVFVRADTR